MKTRVVNIDNETFIPQVWRQTFLFVGEWRGIGKSEVGGFWEWPQFPQMEKHCAYKTEKEANAVVEEFLIYNQKKKRALT